MLCKSVHHEVNFISSSIDIVFIVIVINPLSHLRHSFYERCCPIVLTLNNHMSKAVYISKACIPVFYQN